MADNKFPSVEPPPHPGESEGQSNVSRGEIYSQASYGPQGQTPSDVLQPQEAFNTQAVASAGKETQSTKPPQPVLPPQPPRRVLPKIKFPKVLIIAVIVFLILIALIFLFLRLRPRGVDNLIGQKGEIVWWGLQIEESVILPLIEEYENQHPNVKIKYSKKSSENYRERLTSALASGDGPDIYEIHNSWIPMFSNDLAALPQGVMGKDEFVRTFYSVIVSDLSNQQGIFGIPLEYDALTLFINEDIFASAAKSSPKTWDDLRQLSLEMTQKTGDELILQSGVALGITENVDHWQEVLALMMLQNRVDPAKPEGKFAQDAINFFIQFSVNDRVWDNTLPPSTIAFSKEKLAMYFGPSRRAAEIAQLNPNLKFKTATLPQLPKDKPSDPNVSYATYWVEGVWKKSKNSDISWDFLKYLSSQESLQRLNQERRGRGLLEKAYPRPDMSILQKDDKILGSVLLLAPDAKSWFLADETYDGPTGINSQLSQIYKEIVASKGEKQAMEELVGKITEVLSKYQIFTK